MTYPIYQKRPCELIDITILVRLLSRPLNGILGITQIDACKLECFPRGVWQVREGGTNTRGRDCERSLSKVISRASQNKPMSMTLQYRDLCLPREAQAVNEQINGRQIPLQFVSYPLFGGSPFSVISGQHCFTHNVAVRKLA